MEEKFESICVIGDLHDSMISLTNRIVSDPDRCCYIQVGDFCVGRKSIELEMDRMSAFNILLSSKGSRLIIVRGNHDDPDWFNSSKFDDYKKSLKNILYAEDYSIAKINDENFLFIGGAIGIDRRDYKAQRVPWIDRQAILFDFEKIGSIRNVDRIISHNAPDFVYPTRMGSIVYEYSKRDASLIFDLKEERKNMSRAFSILMSNNKIRENIYGHFHSSYRTIHNNCTFTCLDLCEFKRIY